MNDSSQKKKIHISRERSKARDLRNSKWWKDKISNAQCYYCQVSLVPQDATMDHIVPISRGGFSKPGNIVVSCKDCNTKKSSSTAVELLLEKEQD